MSLTVQETPDGESTASLDALYEDLDVGRELPSGWKVVSRSRLVDAVSDVYVEPGIWRSDESLTVGFYDDERQLTVASRQDGSADWWFTRLPTWIGWDSHNYVSLIADRAGCLHVAANMHATEPPRLQWRLGSGALTGVVAGF